MKFLADQDVYRSTVVFLRELGHDCITASEIGMSAAPDSSLLSRAKSEDRILVTRDRDYGSLVFVGKLKAGVIYLRIDPSAINAVHQELARLLSIYQIDELLHAFVTVEPDRHRFRKLP